MEALLSLLPYIQIALAVILTGSILIQQRGAGLGGAFGGGEGGVHYERRGFERTLFKGTIVISIIFVVSVLASVLIIEPENIDIVNENTVIPTDETVLDLEDITMETSDNGTIDIEIVPIDIVTGEDDVPTASD